MLNASYCVHIHYIGDLATTSHRQTPIQQTDSQLNGHFRRVHDASTSAHPHHLLLFPLPTLPTTHPKLQTKPIQMRSFTNSSATCTRLQHEAKIQRRQASAYMSGLSDCISSHSMGNSGNPN